MIKIIMVKFCNKLHVFPLNLSIPMMKGFNAFSADFSEKHLSKYSIIYDMINLLS
jgi:hypothetical protein